VKTYSFPSLDRTFVYFLSGVAKPDESKVLVHQSPDRPLCVHCSREAELSGGMRIDSDGLCRGLGQALRNLTPSSSFSLIANAHPDRREYGCHFKEGSRP
jgi:hypothetical protein